MKVIRISVLVSALVLNLCSMVSAAEESMAAIALPEGVSDHGYHYSKQVSGEFASVVESLRSELKAAGFGVLTEIDFQAKMQEKLGEQIPPYLILGACHPPLAFEAYQLEPWIGELMPCNFVVRELPEGGVEVSVKNPNALPQATGNAALEPVSAELTTIVLAVLANLD